MIQKLLLTILWRFLKRHKNNLFDVEIKTHAYCICSNQIRKFSLVEKVCLLFTRFWWQLTINKRSIVSIKLWLIAVSFDFLFFASFLLFGLNFLLLFLRNNLIDNLSMLYDFFHRKVDDTVPCLNFISSEIFMDQKQFAQPWIPSFFQNISSLLNYFAYYPYRPFISA